ncbi:TPA: hypothetical protein ACG3P3_001515 [Clostridioides difficile]
MKKIKILWDDVWESFESDSEFLEGIPYINNIDYCVVMDSSGDTALKLRVIYSGKKLSHDWNCVYQNIHGTWVKC